MFWTDLCNSFPKILAIEYQVPVAELFARHITYRATLKMTSRGYGQYLRKSLVFAREKYLFLFIG